MASPRPFGHRFMLAYDDYDPSTGSEACLLGRSDGNVLGSLESRVPSVSCTGKSWKLFVEAGSVVISAGQECRPIPALEWIRQPKRQ